MTTRFRYEALDASGQAQQGEIEADDILAAGAQLKGQGWVVLSIELVQPDRHSTISSGSVAADASSDTLLTYEEKINQRLAHPEELIALLDALAAEPGSTWLRSELDYVTRKLRDRVDARQFLSDERLSIWLPVILSQGQSSVMEMRYSQWLSQVVHERTRRVGLWASFSYPLILLAFVMLVLIPICVFIVPEFQRMFSEFGLMLPGPTRLLFRVADVINLYTLRLILGIGVLLALVGTVAAIWISRAMTTRTMGWLIAGNSVGLIAMSRLTSVLAELLELGAPLPEALMVAGRASRHPYYRDAARDLAVHLMQPEFSWQASPVAHNFPLTLLHAFTAAEGNRPSLPLIRELSQVYSDRVAARLGRRLGAASPLVVLAIGIVVAFVIMALFMPLVQMVTSLS